MAPLNLDFVVRHSWQRTAGYLLLLLLFALGLYQALMYQELSGNLNAWEEKWRSMQPAKRKNSDSDVRGKVQFEQMQVEFKAANRVITKLSMPWDNLFREIEATVNEEVTLLNVEPDTEKNEIRMTVEAKTLTAMLEYMKRMQMMPMFKDAYIANHQIQLQDPQRPVRFLITAQWLKDVQPVSTTEVN